ncbi:MAG: RagB/SusD family nutrient uptake outer membrane protein [Sphingobacteriales bacterium]|nr:MAG: RagB/SusD family nutrient uptake outer membrane protein [Sphingobacteriales bacterium]
MKRKIFSAIIIGAVFASCQKERLDPIPQTQLSDAVAFSTPERAAQQVNGIYSALKQGNFYAGRFQVYMDVRGEEFINFTNNGVTAFLTWNFTQTPTTNEVQNLWAAAYQTINRCNVVIEGIAAATLADNLKKQYTAEAKVVRAISYWSLMQMYARPFTEASGPASPGVPLRLTAITSSGNNNIVRSTVGDVYTQILKDLNEAEVDLPLNYATADLNTTRAHRNTAVSLKTRVLLSMGRYADVITEGNKMVPAAAPFQAATGVANRLNPSIATTFTTYNTTESILSMPYTNLDLPGTQNSLNSYYNPGPNGNGDFVLNTTGNGIVANTNWTATDARRAFNIASGGQTYLRKWPKNAGTDPDWIPVIRYAEVLLNVAEAEARQGTGLNARALALLNAVRQRSDAATTLAPADKDALIAAILLERRIELLGEGLRTADVTRTGANFAAKGSVGAYGPSSNLYIWPISNAEILTNKEMVQNPGY